MSSLVSRARGSFFSPLLLFIFLLFFFAAFPGFSAPSETDLEFLELGQVVFTADRLPLEAELTSGYTSTLYSDQVSPQESRDPSLLLMTVPSLDYSSSSLLGGPASIFLRGANAGHTAILLDGVRLRDPMAPNGALNASLISFAGLERIETVRGALSAAWGSDALGGAIGLHSLKGQGDPWGSLDLSLGSNSTFSRSLSFSGSQDDLSYSLTAQAIGTRGISMAGEIHGNQERDGGDSTLVMARFSRRLKPGLDLDLTLRTQELLTDIDDAGGLGGDDPDRRTENLFNFGSLRLTSLRSCQDRKGQVENRFTFSRSLTRRRDQDQTAPGQSPDYLDCLYRGETRDLEWQYTLTLDKRQFLAGIAWSREGGDSSYRALNAFGPLDSLFPRAKMETASVFTSLHWQGKTTESGLTLALRGDRIHNGDSAVTGRLSLTRPLSPRVMGVLNWGTGFKAPTLYQLHAPVYGEPALQSEESRGWDGGIRVRTGRFGNQEGTLSLTWHSSRIGSLIDFDMNTWKYMNLSRASISGLELSWELPRCSLGRIGLSYFYLKARDDSTGLDLLRRAGRGGSLRLEREMGPTTLFVTATCRADAWDVSGWPSARMELEGGFVTALGLTHQVSEAMSLHLSVTDLFNRAAEQVIGYGAAGRTLEAGLTLRF